MTSCETYKTCNECLIGTGGATDPYCGWCSTSNKCTTRPSCPLATNEAKNSTQWLSGASLTATPDERINMLNSMCIDVTGIAPELVSLTPRTEWIQVNFRKELPKATGGNGSDYQCVYGYQSLVMTTDAFEVAESRFKCSLPHFSRLVRLFAGRFVDQNLTIGEDGIFQVTDKGYYYEESVDRVVLPLYIQSKQSRGVRYGMKNGANETAFNVTVLDCGVRRSCVSCLSSAGSCNWCGNQCVSVNIDIAESGN